MKRTITAAVLLGVLVVGGATIAFGHAAGAAWAQTGDRAARREAAKACMEEARAAHGDDRKAVRQAVKACLGEKGFLPKFTDEQKEQAKACIDQAREANPDAGKRGVRQAARPCLEAAGIVPPLTAEQQARREKLRGCMESARAAHGGDKEAVRAAVKECMIA